jgi:hypothetical protein
MTDNTQDIPASAATETEPTIEIAHESPAPKTAISPAIPGFLGGLAGGVAVSLVVGGGLVTAWPSLHGVMLSEESRRLTQLERAIDDINPRLVAVERELGRYAGGVESAGLAQSLGQKVAALEAQAHAPLADPRIGALADRSDRLSADVTRLITDVQALRGAIPPEGTILRLAERAEAAEKEARELAQQHASAQALLLVVGQLRDAVNRGDPYLYELQAARRIASKDDIAQIDALAPSATEGVLRKESLLSRFPKIAKDAVRAELLPADEGLWQRTLHKLVALVDIRPIDGQGTGTAAVVARAEGGIKEGNLTKAVQELSALKGRPSEVVAPWLKSAQDRLTVDHALSALSASMAAQTAKSGS